MYKNKIKSVTDSPHAFERSQREKAEEGEEAVE